MALAGPLLFSWCGDQAWHILQVFTVLITSVPLTMPNPMAVSFTPVFSASHGGLDPGGSSNEPCGGLCISRGQTAIVPLVNPVVPPAADVFRRSSSYSRLGVRTTPFSEEGARATTRIVEPGTSGR